MKIFFPILGAVVLIAGIYWSVIEFVLKDYKNIGYIQFRYLTDENGDSQGTPAYITSIKSDSNYPDVFEVPSKLLGHPVTGIDAQAFKNLARLKKVILPKTVEEIGDEAFAGCPLLTDVVVKSDLKVLGNDVFEGSGWLDSHSDKEFITFGNFLYKYNGNGTKDFTLKSENDKQASENASDYVYIPSEIVNFANGAFSNQPHLVAVEMPDTFTSIEKEMFRDCQNLVSVELNNVTEIKSDVFNGCTKLESIDFSKLSSIGNGAFKGTAVKSVTLNDKLTTINESIFENCVNLSSLTVPDSVTSIGDDAFAGDVSLTNITLSDNIEKIGNRAFKGTSIENFIFPQKIDTISTELFADDRNLKSVVLPNYSKNNSGIIVINSKAFMNTENLTEINFPKNDEGKETVKTIGASAFEGSGIESITIPSDMLSLENSTFKNCTKLQEVNFYDEGALITINAECFSGTTSLKKIEFPDTVRVFYSAVLKNSGVYEVKLPENTNFSTINNSFFEGCTNLTEVLIPNSVKTMDRYVFKDCTNLKSVTLSDDLRVIDSGLFENATLLTELVIPDKVTSINSDAFKNCTNLENITISKSVKRIENDAFYGDENLVNVYFDGTVEEWKQMQFGNESSNPMHFAEHFFIRDSATDGWVEATDNLDNN